MSDKNEMYLIKDVDENVYLASKPNYSYYRGQTMEWVSDIQEVRKQLRWKTEKTAKRYLERISIKLLEDLKQQKKDSLKREKELEEEVKNQDPNQKNQYTWNSPGYQLQEIQSIISRLNKRITAINSLAKKVTNGDIKVVKEDVGAYAIRFRQGRNMRIDESGSPQASCVMCGVHLDKIPFVYLGIDKGRICPICLEALHNKTKHLITKMDESHVKAIKRSRFVREL